MREIIILEEPDKTLRNAVKVVLARDLFHIFQLWSYNSSSLSLFPDTLIPPFSLSLYLPPPPFYFIPLFLSLSQKTFLWQITDPGVS